MLFLQLFGANKKKNFRLQTWSGSALRVARFECGSISAGASCCSFYRYRGRQGRVRVARAGLAGKRPRKKKSREQRR
jgi:hypothetical protein